MAITFDDLDEAKKGQVTDLLSKREAIDGALADIQTERATSEIGWSQKEQELKAERIVDKQIRHENTQIGMFEGVVYINIECEEGMMTSMDKMKDFVFIEFTDPYGDVYQCNDLACIEIANSAINTNLIKITPTNNTYSFDPMFDAYTNIRIGFVPTAYGDYRITAFVDAAPA